MIHSPPLRLREGYQSGFSPLRRKLSLLAWSSCELPNRGSREPAQSSFSKNKGECGEKAVEAHKELWQWIITFYRACPVSRGITVKFTFFNLTSQCPRANSVSVNGHPYVISKTFDRAVDVCWFSVAITSTIYITSSIWLTQATYKWGPIKAAVDRREAFELKWLNMSPDTHTKAAGASSNT